MVERGPRARAWQHLGRKGIPGRKADPGTPASRAWHAAFVWAGMTAQPEPPARPALRLLRVPARARLQSGIRPAGLRGCVPSASPGRPARQPAARAPAPPRPGPGPRRLPHLHARSPGVDPRVQDGDEHPSPVILRVATEEGGGPGLFLGQEAVEGEGLLGRRGGHGRRLEDEEEANCQVARGRAARGHRGSRGPGRGRGAGPDADQCRPARGSRPITYSYVSQRRRSQELGRSVARAAV